MPLGFFFNSTPTTASPPVESPRVATPLSLRSLARSRLRRSWEDKRGSVNRSARCFWYHNTNKDLLASNPAQLPLQSSCDCDPFEGALHIIKLYIVHPSLYAHLLGHRPGNFEIPIPVISETSMFRMTTS